MNTSSSTRGRIYFLLSFLAVLAMGIFAFEHKLNKMTISKVQQALLEGIPPISTDQVWRLTTPPNSATITLSVDGELTTIHVNPGDSFHVIVNENWKLLHIDHYIDGMNDPVVYQPKIAGPDKQ